MPNFPPIPPNMKHIAHFLKVADEHDERNLVVSYWSRMYGCQVAMKTLPGQKPPEVTALLVAIMDWLEQTKKANLDSDGITNETAAQALIEEYAIQLFQYADAQDQAENFGKNVVKAFYTSGILMDILEQFGTLSEDIQNKRKYAKWKAAYIHNCLKNGDKPIPGPPLQKNLLANSDDEEEAPSSSNAPFSLTNPSLSALTIPPKSFDSPADEANGVPPLLPTPSNIPPLQPQPGGKPINEPEDDVVEDLDDDNDNQELSPSTIARFSITDPILSLLKHPAAHSIDSPSPAGEANIPANIPTPQPRPSVNPAPSTPSSTAAVGTEQIGKAQKYCKWAESALNYDDVNTAIDNLQKALHLLQFGVEK